MAHLQRTEDVLLDVALVGLSAHGLHDEPEHRVVDRAVLVRRTHGLCQLGGAQLADGPFQCVVTRIPISLERPPCLCRQTAGLIQEVADGDLGGGTFVGHTEPGDVSLHRRVEVDLPRLDQLHDRQGSDRLAQGADDEGRLWRDGPPRLVGLAEAAHVDDSIALDDPEGEAGDALRIHLGLDERVYRAEIRRGSRRFAGSTGVGSSGTAGQKGSSKDQCREQ